MARPVNADAQQTRRRIQGEAARLFADHGVAGTRVRDISSAAGVNVAMISHCFGGKEALYRTCVEEVYGELDLLESSLSADILKGADPHAVLAQAVRMSFRLARRERHAVRLIMREVLDRGGQDPMRVQKVLLPFLDKAADLFGPREDIADLRLSLQSVIFLIVRFALSPEEELKLVISDPEEPLQRTEDYLVEAAQRLLLPLPHSLYNII